MEEQLSCQWRLQVLVVSGLGAASGTSPDVLAARLAEALSPFSSAAQPCRGRPGTWRCVPGAVGAEN